MSEALTQARCAFSRFLSLPVFLFLAGPVKQASWTTGRLSKVELNGDWGTKARWVGLVSGWYPWCRKVGSDWGPEQNLALEPNPSP